MSNFVFFIFLPVEHRSYTEIFKLTYTKLVLPVKRPFNFTLFLTPKMDSLTPKTWAKSLNNIEIGPNFIYPVFRGLETGFGGAVSF